MLLLSDTCKVPFTPPEAVQAIETVAEAVPGSAENAMSVGVVGTAAAFVTLNVSPFR